MRRCPCCFHSTGSHQTPVLNDARTTENILNKEKNTGDVIRQKNFAAVIDSYKKSCPRCRYKLEHHDIAMCDHCTANQMLQRALNYFAPSTLALKERKSDVLAISRGLRSEREKTFRQLNKEAEQSRRQPESAKNGIKTTPSAKEDEQLTPHTKEIPIYNDFFPFSAHKSNQIKKDVEDLEESRTQNDDNRFDDKKRVNAAEKGIPDKNNGESAEKDIIRRSKSSKDSFSLEERKIRTKEQNIIISGSLKDILSTKEGKGDTSRNKKRDSSTTRRSSKESKKTTLTKNKTEFSKVTSSSKKRRSSTSRSSEDSFASDKRKSSISRKEKSESKTRPSAKERKRSPTRKEKGASIIPMIPLKDQMKDPLSEGQDKSGNVKRQEIREALRYEKERKSSAARKLKPVSSKHRLSSEERMKSRSKNEVIESSKEGLTSIEQSLEDEMKLDHKVLEDKTKQQIKVEERDEVNANEEAEEENVINEQKRQERKRINLAGIEFLSKSLQKMFNFEQNEEYAYASQKEKASLKTLLFDFKWVQKKEHAKFTIARETSEGEDEGTKRVEYESALQEKMKSAKKPHDENKGTKRGEDEKPQKRIYLKKPLDDVSLRNEKEIKIKGNEQVDKPITKGKQSVKKQDSGDQMKQKTFEEMQSKSNKRDENNNNDINLISSLERRNEEKQRKKKQETIKYYTEINRQEDVLERKNRLYVRGEIKKKRSHKAPKATLGVAGKGKEERALEKAAKVRMPKGSNMQTKSLEQIILDIIKMSNKTMVVNVPFPQKNKLRRTSSFGELRISMEPYGKKNMEDAIEKTPALIKVLIDYVKDFDMVNESTARDDLEFVKDKLLAPDFLNKMKQLKLNIPNSDIQLGVESYLNLADIITKKKIRFKIKNTKVMSFRPKHAKTRKSAAFNVIRRMHTFKLMEDPSPSSTENNHIEQGDDGHGRIRYALSDPTFIENGWTQLPVEKVLRKVFLFNMWPAQPEFNWLQNRHKNIPLQYDTGEKFVEVKDNGHTICFYKNRNIALEYYECEDPSSKQLILVYSDGEPKCGEQMPVCLLAMFDYMGNGVVYDNFGAVRLIYNQYEGRTVDENLGPITHWQWHSLNDPPQLQSVITDTTNIKKDPHIIKLCEESKDEVKDKRKTQENNPEMLAVERKRQVKERMEKERVNKKFCPYPVKIKVVKINDQFSLKILDQTKIYLTFREGLTKFRINVGLILDSREIVDTNMVRELGGTTNSLEGEVPKTESVQNIQSLLKATRRFGRRRKERYNRLRMPLPSLSVDKMMSALACPSIRTNPQCS